LSAKSGQPGRSAFLRFADGVKNQGGIGAFGRGEVLQTVGFRIIFGFGDRSLSRELDDGAGAEVVRELVAIDDLDSDAAVTGVVLGEGDFVLDVGAFVEEGAGAVAERGGEEGKGLLQGGDGAGGDQVDPLFLQPLFCAEGDDGDVGEFESLNGGLNEAGLLLDGLKQEKLGVRQDQRERDAGETGSGAGVGDAPGILEEAPGHYRIQDVFDGGLALSQDAR